MTMVEALVSTILSQLASLATEEVKLLACADKAVGKLTSNFQAIRAVLEDAESRQMKEKSVGDWLDKLKHVSYDIEDVLDEWITASKKLQMKEAENASKLWKKLINPAETFGDIVSDFHSVECTSASIQALKSLRNCILGIVKEK